MRVGIIDADLIGRNSHRFPNLASMKISGYHKEKGDEVTLITEYLQYSQIGKNTLIYKKLFDKIYVSKVFVDTPVPYEVLNLDMTVYGGTGFFYSDAEPLPYEIEHHMPDYHLYDELIEQEKIRKGDKFNPSEFKYYTDFSIGFTTRGCIMHCQFCVNKHYDRVGKASCVDEFLNTDRPWICLLDDNILAYEDWREVLDELDATKKPYEFKQGLDIRNLNEEKTKRLMSSNLRLSNLYFAFDNIEDKGIIEGKLKLWKKYYKKNTNMYVLCGFDREGKYNEQFWDKDIKDTLERIKICIKYGVYPYIMRYRMYKFAPIAYKGMYINLASWCNQKTMFTKYTLNEWADYMQQLTEDKFNSKKLYSTKRYLMLYEGRSPDTAYEYFNLNLMKHREFEYEKDNKDKVEIIENVGNLEDIAIENEELKNDISKEVLKVANTLESKKRVEKSIEHVMQVLKPTLENIDKNNKKQKSITFNYTNLKKIFLQNDEVGTAIINCKEEQLEEYEKTLMIYLNTCILSKDINLYVNNIDVKSFNLTKDFIEKNTNFKFLGVVAPQIKGTEGKKTTIYCSKYSTNTDNNDIFINENIRLKSVLFQKIISDTNKNKDIVCFFQNISSIKNRTKRQIYCLKKEGQECNKLVVKNMNKDIDKVIMQKTQEQQLSLLQNHTEEQNIG